jgi:hypothetical protein
MNNIHKHGDEPKRRYRRSFGAIVLTVSVAAGFAACGDKDSVVPAAEVQAAQDEKFWEPYINVPARQEKPAVRPYLEYQAGRRTELRQAMGSDLHLENLAGEIADKVAARDYVLGSDRHLEQRAKDIADKLASSRTSRVKAV